MSDDRVTVMHVLTSFQVGGAEIVALELARSMDPHRFRVVACSLGGPGPMGDRFREAGLDTMVAGGSTTRWLGQFVLVRALARCVRRARADIVHCHNQKPLVYGALAGWLAGAGAVVGTRHAIGTRHKPGQPWTLERAVAPFVAHQVAVSEFVLARGLSTGRMPRDNSSVIHNGIDVDRFHPRDGAGADGALVVGCVARLSEEKRHVDLLRATEILARQGTDFRLRLVGDGPERTQIQALADDLGLAERVELLGTRDDVPDLLRGMDVFVLASRTEGLPLSVIEAMASGLPVVATRIGGIPEAVEHQVSGLLVDACEPGQLAGAIGRLLTDADLRRRLGRAARARARGEFSLAGCGEAHAALYGRLLGLDPAPAGSAADVPPGRPSDAEA